MEQLKVNQIMSRFIIGKVRSKDLKLGATEAKQCQEISNYLDNSVLTDKQSEWFRDLKTLFYLKRFLKI